MDWKPSLKKYPHFDAILSIKEIESIVRDPIIVSKHAFFPFLKYDQRWNFFSQKGKKGKVKERPIRYASHLDSCIFSYYRYLLSSLYEKKIKIQNLDRSILAYRHIKNRKTGKGCCNIDFALDAINTITEYKSCCAIALDISSFFENLNHKAVYDSWTSLLGVKRLPDDHYNVFKAITKYASVDLIEAYKRLGFIGTKKRKSGLIYEGYLCSKKDIPIQLCSGANFRQKIAGGDGTPSIIKKNIDGFGIPQGAPLSDLLANLYLYDFDKYVQEKCDKLNGRYFRYSDDILIIVPVTFLEANDLEKDIREKISELGHGLKIKEEKSSIHEFVSTGATQSIKVRKATTRDNLPSTTKPFEYLGFRFNGNKIYIRDKTLSSLHRKIVLVCRAKAISLKKRYNNKSKAEILSKYNFERLYQLFGNVENFIDKSALYKNWTFITYIKRAVKLVGDMGTPIQKQISGLRMKVKKRFEHELSKLF